MRYLATFRLLVASPAFALPSAVLAPLADMAELDAMNKE